MDSRSDIQLVTKNKGRLAPTPSGYLHRGNGFSFVLTWLLVRKAGGELLLRIDDADAERARPEYIQDIFQCLDWLGLDWDRGPAGPDDFAAHYSQENRFPHYQQVLDLLREEGVVYACDCSRSQIRNQYANGIYRGSCRRQKRSLEDPQLAWRLEVPHGEEVCFWEVGQGECCLSLADYMGDFVVRRKGGLPAYQIASLVDDLDWGSSLVVRGEDLLYSTAAQLYLARCLARQERVPLLQQSAKAFEKAQFLHHPLMLDEKGEKLSKSAGSISLKSLREAGGNPMPVYALVADYLKLPADAAASLGELLEAFKNE